MATKSELIWAAGLIDGEGCISLTCRLPQRHNRAVSPNYRMILKVAMCHKATVRRLHKIFACGTVQPQRVQRPYFSTPWIWFCNAGATQQVLMQVRPWLFTKAHEADVALEFLALELATRGGAQGSVIVPAALAKRRARFHRQLRQLKTRNLARDRKLLCQK
jgi:hypothetical protein